MERKLGIWNSELREFAAVGNDKICKIFLRVEDKITKEKILEMLGQITI